MARWLLKTEPGSYSWDDLVRDKKTTWEGVANALALQYIRSMKKGDVALIYHTGAERAAIGTAELTSGPYADPNEPNGRGVVVDLKPTKKLAKPVTLSEMKADPAFAGWVFLRIGRLSVAPVPDEMWARIEALAERE